MALTDFQETIVSLNKEKISDGMGGIIDKWTEGATFKGVIQRASASEQSLATQQGMAEIWILICSNNINLSRNDYIKHDNRYLRITDEELKTPAKASARVQSHQYKAELVGGLPNV